MVECDDLFDSEFRKKWRKRGRLASRLPVCARSWMVVMPLTKVGNKGKGVGL